MTILLIIVSIMATIFTESERAWRLGTGRADCNTEGRAALNAIAQDMEYAIADNVLSFVMRPDTERGTPKAPNVSYGYTNSEICFVSLREDATNNAANSKRTAAEVYYWVRPTTDNDEAGGKWLGRYQLMRTIVNTFQDPLPGPTADRNAYFNRNWYNRDANKGGRDNAGSRGVMAENICALRFTAPSNGVTTLSYDSTLNNHRVPEYVDVMIELLSDENAQRAAQLQMRVGTGGIQQREVGEFVDKNVHRYTTRVYFQNRSGYKKRP